MSSKNVLAIDKKYFYFVLLSIIIFYLLEKKNNMHNITLNMILIFRIISEELRLHLSNNIEAKRVDLRKSKSESNTILRKVLICF